MAALAGTGPSPRTYSRPDAIHPRPSGIPGVGRAVTGLRGAGSTTLLPPCPAPASCDSAREHPHAGVGVWPLHRSPAREGSVVRLTPRRVRHEQGRASTGLPDGLRHHARSRDRPPHQRSRPHPSPELHHSLAPGGAWRPPGRGTVRRVAIRTATEVRQPILRPGARRRRPPGRALHVGRWAARFARVEASPASWSSLLFPSGTSDAWLRHLR